MPITSQPGQSNVGTQQTIQITCNNPAIAPTGIIYMDGRREEFSSKGNDKIEMTEPCDNGGVKDITRIPGEITGTFKIARLNAAFSAVIAALDAAFYNGLPNTAFSILSTEPTADGSGLINIFQYTNVNFHEPDFGAWSRNSKTMCSVNFTASQRIQLQ